MTRISKNRLWVVAAALALACSAVQAEDVEKKFRIGLSIGGYDSRDQVPSDSANILTITDERDVPVTFFEDPRNDGAAIGELRIEPTPRAVLSAQYAVNKIFLVEFSAGYQKGDVGKIEVQAQFLNDPIPVNERFNFRIFRITAGELEQVPLKLTALARFRPRARFNPFIGAGVGFTFIGFTPSDELNELSRNMDNSTGGFAQLQPFPGRFSSPTSIGDLDGASVDARDTFSWHVAAGAELSLKRKWAAFVDVRYSYASRSMRIQFNGEDTLGISVPQQRVFQTDPEATAPYGSYSILDGGIIDGGRLVPVDPDDPPAICETEPGACTFALEPDGEADPGFYYVQGGDFRYDNITIQFGVRYTF